MNFRYLAASVRDLSLNALNFRGFGIKSDSKFKQIVVPGYKNSFFGYYDTSPFNPTDSDTLVLHANNANHFKRPQCQSLAIVIVNHRNGESKVVTETKAWNWQQGSRLSWLDRKRIILNDFDSSKKTYYSKVVDLESDEIMHYDRPNQCVFKDQWFLSINYDPLQMIRPDYGYNCKKAFPNSFLENGIWKTDFLSGTTEQLLSISEILKECCPDIHVIEAKAKINHVLVSPNGESFIYLVRYFSKATRRHVLFHYDFASNTNRAIIESQVVSHYCWVDNQRVFFWGVVDGISGYYMIDVISGLISIANGDFGDGHPHVFDDSQLVSDTYAAKSGFRDVYFIDHETYKKQMIAELYHSPFLRGEQRCDPHPSVSLDRKFLQVDAATSKGRNAVIFELNK